MVDGEAGEALLIGERVGDEVQLCVHCGDSLVAEREVVRDASVEDDRAVERRAAGRLDRDDHGPALGACVGDLGPPADSTTTLLAAAFGPENAPKTRPANAPGVQVQVACGRLSRFKIPTRSVAKTLKIGASTLARALKIEEPVAAE